MSDHARLPVVATVRRTYGLLWDHRLLHLKAIWPPIVFLAAAEFLFHKVVGNAKGIGGILDALRDADWYWLAAIAMLWLAGLKFLLSFSISWRRHVMLGERFDPFYFRKPFWRYLLELFRLYCICGLYSSAVVVISLLMSMAHADFQAMPMATNVGPSRVWQLSDTYIAAAGLAIFAGIIKAIHRVPYFTAISLDDGQATLSQSRSLMHYNLLRYLAIWLLAMLPVIAFSQLVTLVSHAFGLDVAATPVALAESAFRQACLFVHFSLGASIGMMTYAALVQGRRPETIH